MSHNTTMQASQKNVLFSQGENAEKTYTIEWAGLLGTETISTSTWTAETSGATLANEANTDNQASARISATPGTYLFTNKITLSDGDTREAQMQVEVKSNQRRANSDYCGYHRYH